MNRRHRYHIFLALLLSALGLILAGCGSAPAPTDTAAAAIPSTSTPLPADTSAPAPADTQAPSPTDTQAPPANTQAPSPTDTEVSPTATATSGDGAGNADVTFVEATQAAGGTWTFAVTVEHPDTGWEDYADGWDVVTPDGQVLKPNPDDAFTRVLLHPHENEQPFTRSQSGIVIPEGVTQVRVRAHDLVDGFGGQEVVVDLTADSGPNFEVQR
jgi:cytoskeletal protein RodZ